MSEFDQTNLWNGVTTIGSFCLGCKKAVELLIANGARINSINNDGYAALDYAYNATEGKL